jgi:hypothetical protein
MLVDVQGQLVHGQVLLKWQCLGSTDSMQVVSFKKIT